jgi:hypothetical protein
MVSPPDEQAYHPQSPKTADVVRESRTGPAAYVGEQRKFRGRLYAILALEQPGWRDAAARKRLVLGAKTCQIKS